MLKFTKTRIDPDRNAVETAASALPTDLPVEREVNPLLSSSVPTLPEKERMAKLTKREIYREMVTDLHQAHVSRGSLLLETVKGVAATVTRWGAGLALFNFALQAAAEQQVLKAVVFLGAWFAGESCAAIIDRTWRCRVDEHERAFERRLNSKLVAALGRASLPKLDDPEFQAAIELQRDRAPELAKVVESAVELPSHLTKLALSAGALFVVDWRISVVVGLATLPGLLLRDRQSKSDMSLEDAQGQHQKVHEALSAETYSSNGSLRMILGNFTERVRSTLDHTREVLDRQKDQHERKQAVQSVVTDLTYYTALFGGFYLLLSQYQGGAIELGMLTFLSFQLADLATDLDQHGDTIREYFDYSRKLRQFYTLTAPDTPHAGIEMPQNHTLEFKGVSFTRGSVQENFTAILPDFELSPGGLLIIHGASGAGKSTILKHLAFRAAPSDGQVLVGGENLMSVDLRSWLRSCSYCGATPSLLQGLSVLEALSLDGANDFVVAERAQHPLLETLVQGLSKSHGLDSRIGLGLANGREFSTGELLRLTLVPAIVPAPKFLFLDEITANQSDNFVAIIEQEIKRLRSLGTTIIFATHSKRFDADASHIIQVSRGQAELTPSRAEEVQIAPNLSA